MELTDLQIIAESDELTAEKTQLGAPDRPTAGQIARLP